MPSGPFSTSLLLLGLILAGCATAKATPALGPEALAIWRYASLEQNSAGFVFKWVDEASTPQAPCAAKIRVGTERGTVAPVKMLGWYPLPGRPHQWVGCWPVGYDFYAPG